MFVEVCDVADADIVISWEAGNHGDPCANPAYCFFDGPNGILAHAYFPPPQGGVLAGEIHFDEGENWTDVATNNTNQPIDLVAVAIHEIGHAIGLAHTQLANTTALMHRDFYLNRVGAARRTFTQDDISGVRSLYGTDHIITGPALVCRNATGSFSFQMPTGVDNINWTRSSNLQQVSGQGTNNYTIRANGTAAGEAWVQANITIGCANISVRREFQAGPFNTGQVAVSGTAGVCPGQTYVYNAVMPGGPQPGYSYTWSKPNNWIWPCCGTNFPQITLTTPQFSTPDGGVVGVSINNTCGATASVGLTVFPLCFSFIAYPNPADNNITIAAVGNDDKANTLLGESAVLGVGYTAVLFDNFGENVKTITTNKKESAIDTSDLKKGLYHLKISYSDQEHEHEIIIKH